ncbi:MAG TPA: HEPN domain-containing protein, partial [bacterium]|nr:HEPN domain-containing protein [bacterium]
CFAAQQAAEKALKALYLSRHLEGWGHSVKHLLEEMKEELEISEELLAAGKKLDQYYILTRYPNGFAAGKPADYYTDQDACEAIGHAEKIIEFCEGEIRSA